LERLGFVTGFVAAWLRGVLGSVVRMGVLVVDVVVYVDFMTMGVCVFDFACYEESG
jgi:hypothetical protein